MKRFLLVSLFLFLLPFLNPQILPDETLPVGTAKAVTDMQSCYLCSRYDVPWACQQCLMYILWDWRNEWFEGGCHPLNDWCWCWYCFDWDW